MRKLQRYMGNESVKTDIVKGALSSIARWRSARESEEKPPNGRIGKTMNNKNDDDDSDGAFV